MSDTSFDIDIDVASATVAPAAAALDQLTARLTAAGEASTAAAEAVKTAEAAYRQTEAAADRAAKALEKIGLQADQQRGKLQAALEAGDQSGIDRATAALDALQQREGEARAKVDAATAAMRAQAATLDQLRTASKAAEVAEEQLTKEHAKAAEALKKAQAADKANAAAAAGSGKYNEYAEGLAKLPGPLGAVGQKAFATAEGFKKLSAAAGTGAGAMIAAAVVVAALVALVVLGTVAILKWSVAMADASRTSELLNEGITESVKGGQELTDKIAGLSRKVPQTRDELQKMAADLAKTGLRGKELSDALEAAAVKAAKQKFGPNWERQMLSLDKQAQVFKDNITDIFGHLKIEGLLEGLQKLIGLFDASSATGRALKVVFEDVFQKLIDQLASLAPLAIAAFIQIEIWALKGLIAIKPYGSTIATVAKGLAVVAAIIAGVLVVALAEAIAFAVAFLTVVYTVWRVIIDWGQSMYATAAAVWAFGESIINGASGALDWLHHKFDEVVAFLSGLNFSDLGTQIIMGLVNGLMGGGPAVLSAIAGIAGGAIDAAKNLLKINSPSKVFAEIGMSTGEGMAQGVDRSTDGVQASMENMVASPADGGGAGGGATSPAGGGSSSSSSRTADLSGMTLIINGVKDAADAAAKVREALIEILDGEVAMGGAAEAPANA